MKACRPCELLPLDIVSQADDLTEIGFGRTNGDASWVAGGIDCQIDDIENVSL